MYHVDFVVSSSARCTAVHDDFTPYFVKLTNSIPPAQCPPPKKNKRFSSARVRFPLFFHFSASQKVYLTPFTGADASLTEPIRAGEVKKGKIILLKGFPCKVIEMTTSKTGKHGHAKANITGVDIFTGKKYEEISPTSHNMEAPRVTTTVYLVSDISEDGFASLLDEDSGDTREDLKVPDVNSPNPELGDVIRKAFEDGKDIYVTVTKSMHTECITAARIAATAN